MLTDAEIPDWPDAYRRECLDPLGITVEPQPEADSPIRTRFATTSTTPDGLNARIDHFLLRLPRRAAGAEPSR